MQNSSQVIYQIKNLENNHRYIGSTMEKERRWQEHRNTLEYGKHDNSHLQNAWDRHSAESFEFSVLEEVENIENLIDREQYYIDKLEPKYNIVPRADRSKVAEETKEKISKNHVNYSGEKNPMYGECLSEKTKRKMSKSQKGIEHTKEAKEKLSEAMQGENNPMYGKTGEKHPKAKLTGKKVKIILHLLNGGQFTQCEIGKMFGVGRRAISKINTGKNWDHVVI